jgi:NAD+ kinase
VRIGLTLNVAKPRAIALGRRVLERFADRAEFVVAREGAEALGRPAGGPALAELEADLLLVLGGDGTFLYTLQHTLLPILAVHAGTVGFLAEIDGEDLAAFDTAMERVLARDYFVEDRMKLGVEIDGRPLPDATNEVVVHTSQVAKIRHYSIAIDDRPVGHLRADGIILATPTGSTSYALSALGPVVEPGIEAILLTTLAPFQLTQRAVLIDPLRSVTIRVGGPERDAVVVVDGRDPVTLAAGSALKVYRSPRRASFVRFGGSFLHRMRGKEILPWKDAEEPPRGSKGANDVPTAA